MKITVTGQSGTGSTTTAKLLASKLQYTFVSAGEVFREFATKLQMDIKSFDEYVQEHPEYDFAIDKKQAEFGKTNDNFVYESRLGWRLIPDSVKILITCSIEPRIQRVMSKENIGEDVAKEHIEKREQSHKKRFFDQHGIENALEPSHFDFVIDSSTDKPEVIVEKILVLLSK